MKIYRLILLSVLLVLAISSCTKKQNKVDKNINPPTDTTQATTVVKKIYYSLPSSMELASIVKDRDSLFDATELYSLDSIRYHISDRSKAVILGVYSADLGFLLIMRQSQNLKAYSHNLINLAEDLDIRQGIDDTLFQEIEKNISNQDTIIKICSKAFFKADAFMKENNKIDISTLILNGAWIESLYQIAMILNKSPNDTNLAKILVDQRLVMENILKLNEIYLKDKYLSEQIKTLKPFFDAIVTEKKSEIYDSFADTTILKTTIIYDFDKNKILNLTNKISRIRQNIVILQ